MEAQPREAAGKRSRAVYITRHGMRLDWVNPDWHLEKGEKACDSPLSDDGLQQARELGQRLADVDLDYIFSSPFLRCVQTADAVAAAQEERRRQARRRGLQSDANADGPETVPIFIEHALGEWDDGKHISSRTLAELKALFPRVDGETYTSVIQPHQVDDDVTGSYKGESVHDLHLRCERFVDFVNQHEVFGADGKHILFVGHAASTIAFYRAWMQDRTADFFPATCSLSKLVLLADDDSDPSARGVEVAIAGSKSNGAPTVGTFSPPRRPKRWRAELSGDCSHLSSGPQKPWRFSELHDQELAANGLREQ